MATRRDAILSGTARAAELHKELGLKEALRQGNRPLDVLGAIRGIGLFVLFRPLESLLGAYLPLSGTAGIVVTTQRGLHIQRFTAAHELGHHVLSHRIVSMDRDVGFVARGEREGHDFQELEADAFAAEFMLPAWLIAAHARRHKWGKQDLKIQDIVYQLSLRLGASYSATCWALASNGFLTRAEATMLANIPPKAAKQRASAGVEPVSWHADVWALSESDQGLQVLGGPEDLLVLGLVEHVAGGYEWDVATVQGTGLHVSKDEREQADPTALGAPVTRRLVIQGEAAGTLRIEERRPWQRRDAALQTFELELALHGKESGGLPRSSRQLAA